MEKNNVSYKKIIDYIKNNKNMSEEKRRMLINYATQLNLNNIENKQEEKIEDLFNDLEVLTDYLKNCNETSIVAERLKKELKIFEMINVYYKEKNDDFSDISFELDGLYLDTELKIRRNSSLAYNLDKEKRNIKK